jgi:hypothetical protein
MEVPAKPCLEKQLLAAISMDSLPLIALPSAYLSKRFLGLLF